MNQLSNILVFILIICVNGCNIQPQGNKQIKDQKIEQLSQREDVYLDSIQFEKGETLDEFLKRAIEIAKSDNEEDLKTIINFPLIGYADTYEKNFKTFDDLKSDGRIYSFFKESLPLAINVKEDEELGEKWYSVKYKYPQGKNDYYIYYKIDKVNGRNIIVGVCIPGY